MGFLDIFRASKVSRGMRKGSAVIKARPGREEKVVQGSHEMVRPAQLPSPVMPKADTRKPVGRYALAAAGAGVAAAALSTGETKTETQIPMRPKGRATSTAPGGASAPVPSKTMQEAPKPSIPKGSSSPARKSAPKPSQKATGASKGQGKAMKGAELANFLGLSADSAVRTYMETGKHKYPSKKK